MTIQHLLALARGPLSRMIALESGREGHVLWRTGEGHLHVVNNDLPSKKKRAGKSIQG